jgi:hypothetical protein
MFPLSLLLQASVQGVLVASVNTVIIIPAISQIFVKNVNGSLTQDFRFQVFSRISYPLAPGYPIHWCFSNFSDNSLRFFRTLCLTPVSCDWQYITGGVIDTGDKALFRTVIDSRQNTAERHR